MEKQLKISLILAVGLLILSNKYLIAQEKSIPGKVEGGFNIISNNFHDRNPSDYVLISGYGYTFLNGLFIKKHFENKSYRFGINHQSVAVDHKAKNEHERDTLNSVGDYSRTAIFVGGEKTFYERKIFQTYWGIDLSLHIDRYEGTSESIVSNSTFNSTISRNGLGVTPFIGARVTLAQRVRVSVETKGGYYLYNKIESIKDVHSSTERKSMDNSVMDVSIQMYATVSYLF